MKRGFEAASFYGGVYASPRDMSPRDLKRIRKLEKAAKFVGERKASDALKCSFKDPNLASDGTSGSSILSSHPKYYQVFSRQCEALKAAEADRDNLKVFAFEVDFSGKRQFVCCHPLTLWTFYKHLKKRHYYEVIPSDKPCKLYFDLEFKTELNPDLDGCQMVKQFKERLAQDLGQFFGQQPEPDILDLDSTTDVKFSRHLILPSHIFVNLNQMRAYVLSFCGKLRQDPSFPKIRTSSQSNDTSTAAIFVDEGVYTKNRNFRLYMSSKFGKDTALEIAQNESGNSGKQRLTAGDVCENRKSVFFDSLITNVDTFYFLQFCEEEELSTFKPDFNASSMATGSNGRGSGGHHQHLSPFPEVDAFVVTLINDLESGRTGYVRKWTQNGSFLTYDIAGSFKFCHNVGRHHKSNNIKYVVDLDKGNYFQTCHDEICKDYR